MKFKQDKNIWITIQKEKVKNPGVVNGQKQLSTILHLRDLIICEYKYKVMPHFILYPTLETGCFLSLTGISFDEILEKSKSWDKQKPLIETSELSRLYDLTDNDIIIRQINCSQILERLLAERVQSKDQDIDKKFDFERDFYGRKGFWTYKDHFTLRLMALIFAIIYRPYSLII